MDIGLAWLLKNAPNDTQLARSMMIKGIKAEAFFTKDDRGNAGFFVQSRAPGKLPTDCFNLEFIAATPQVQVSEINAAWIGTQGQDFKNGNPCLFDYAYMAGWLEKVFHWNLKHRRYDLWTITDAAAGRCQYRTAGQVVSMWQGTQILLTPFSVLKYGMPFYTKTGGLFPRKLLESSAKAQKEFCSKMKEARNMGKTKLNDLVKELMTTSALKLNHVIGRMNGGKGPKQGDTFAKLLHDKSVWMEVQNESRNCDESTSLMRLLTSWPCRVDFAGDQESQQRCFQHKGTIRYMTQLGNKYGRFILDNKKQENLICDFFDNKWKIKFWWMPSFRGYWEKAKRKAWGLFTNAHNDEVEL